MSSYLYFIDPKGSKTFRVYILLDKRFPLARICRNVLITPPAKLIPIKWMPDVCAITATFGEEKIGGESIGQITDRGLESFAIWHGWDYALARVGEVGRGSAVFIP